MSRTTTAKRKLLSLSVAGVLAVGFASGAVIAASISSASASDPSDADKAYFPVNEQGETYGSAIDQAPDGIEPDLIAAINQDGREGYIKKTDLEEAHPAAQGADDPRFTTKDIRGVEVAVIETGIDEIPFYAEDGRTIIGTFVVNPEQRGARVDVGADGESSLPEGSNFDFDFDLH